ncbi:hypothetical protein DKX38_019557 [Salix brachista]|uniref:Uncharacterized protein n=1 Tax=Salix brachista TaxID=2182728 RepID=A0A5N5KGU9_9ROSI|nr:hypothetical protein DKX38_019557 [Salix brachista]
MNKISKLIVFMLLHGLMILSPPTGGTYMVQAYDTADRQAAALGTTSSRNWNFPRKLKVAYPLEKLKGLGTSHDKTYRGGGQFLMMLRNLSYWQLASLGGVNSCQFIGTVDELTSKDLNGSRSTSAKDLL